MDIKKSKTLLKFIGFGLEIIGVIGAFLVPIMFTIVLPISKAMDYYANNGQGIGMIVKTVLIVALLSPLLAAVIFLAFFLPGAALFTLCTQENQQEPQIQPIQEPYDPRNDFYIVKEDNPNRSDAGIAEMNWRLKHQKEENNDG